jgi:hypothetical protein
MGVRRKGTGEMEMGEGYFMFVFVCVRSYSVTLSLVGSFLCFSLLPVPALFNVLRVDRPIT